MSFSPSQGLHSPTSTAILARVVPAEVIEAALAEAGKGGQRLRKLPPTLTLWLLVGMGFYRSLSVRNVLRRLQEELGSALVPWGPAETPHSTSISAACDRLDWKTVRLVFRKLAASLETQHADSDRWRGLVVQALDGTSFRTPDSEANEAAFGRPGSSRGESAYPQLRALMVMGAWSHLVSEVTLGPWKASEISLARDYLLQRLRPGNLILMDRGFFSYAWLHDVHEHGTFFLARAKTGSRALKIKRTRQLAEGDWLGELVCPPKLRRERPDLPRTLSVRILSYTKPGYAPVTVVTNVLDHKAYPGKELCFLYHERWEIELGFRELKTYQSKVSVHFRTKTPERVLQEVYGLLIGYNAVRGLMAEAAAEAGLLPTRLSFTDCLERTRGALRDLRTSPLEDWPCQRARLIADLARYRLPPRREGRRYQRAVKIKMSNWPRKRRGQPAATSRNRQKRPSVASVP